MVSAVDNNSSVDDTTQVDETAEGELDSQGRPKMPESVQPYIDEGVISYEDAEACGFLSNPENAPLLALFETARQQGLKLELHRVDLQTGTFEFKVKSANERLDGATVSLVMTTAGAVLGLTAGAGMAAKARGKGGESSGMDNMGSLAGGAILQVFKSGGEVGEAAIGVDAAESQAFAEIFEQNYQAMTSDVGRNNDTASGAVGAMR